MIEVGASHTEIPQAPVDHTAVTLGHHLRQVCAAEDLIEIASHSDGDCHDLLFGHGFGPPPPRRQLRNVTNSQPVLLSVHR